jgi:hypothetical protein
MKQSAPKVAAQNIEICKSMTAAEISAKFADIFSNTLSRSNFIKVLAKNGIDFNRMEYMENSTEFQVIDKYSQHLRQTTNLTYNKRIHNNSVNERGINDLFYPFCTVVYLSAKEIHIVPCEYGKVGQITPNVTIVR